MVSEVLPLPKMQYDKIKRLQSVEEIEAAGGQGRGGGSQKSAAVGMDHGSVLSVRTMADRSSGGDSVLFSSRRGPGRGNYCGAYLGLRPDSLGYVAFSIT